MARLPRLTLPGYVHHVMQRGNNRQAVFLSSADYQFFLTLLEEQAHQFGVALHAYVLMPDHFHLLATPTSDDGLPNMMQAIGRRYVRYFNDEQIRTGTLWEGRYRSTLMDAERYLLNCMVFMDLNPVRCGLVTRARDYGWSSYGHYAGFHSNKRITPHSLLWTLGNTPFDREAAYAELVQTGLRSDQQAVLIKSIRSGWALGDADFVCELQKKTMRRVLPGRPGRPSGKSLQP